MKIPEGLVATFYILGFLFLIGGAVLIGLGVKKGADNKTFRRENVALPFAGYLDVNNDQKAGATNVKLSCPTGTHINVLGAYLGIYDPYLTCLGAGQTPVSAKSATDKNPALPSIFAQTFCDPTNKNGSSPVCSKQASGAIYGINSDCQIAQGSGFQNRVQDITYHVYKDCEGKNQCSFKANNYGEPATGKRGSSANALSSSQLPSVPTGSGNNVIQDYMLFGTYTCVANDS